MKLRFWLPIAIVGILGFTGWLAWQELRPGLGLGAQWAVLDVHDGDTLRVQRGTQVERVRLACIDAPELSQPFGRASRDHLRQLVAANQKRVFLKVSGRDRYGRTVAEVFSKGRFLQAEQVRSGLAYVYPQYLASCPDAAVIQRAEALAKRQRSGIWKYPHTQRPWVYRRSQ